MKIYTKKGDAGDTGLLFGGARVSKAGGRTEAAGCVDEAVAVLGVARATLPAGEPLANMVIRLQRELFVVGAELSTHRIRRARLTPGMSLVTGEMVEALEIEIDEFTKANPMPVEFIVPGESQSGAALDVARSVVRRAERRAVALAAAERLPDSLVVPYLNRLADLLFVMARVADGGFRPVRSRDR